MKRILNQLRFGTAIAAALVFAWPAIGAVFFEENFDDTTTAGLVAQGWDLGKNEFALEASTDFAVVPPYLVRAPGSSTGNVFPATEDGTGSTGKYLLSDSDASPGSDNVGSGSEFWAITPSFSTQGTTGEVWFHADTEIESNNNGECAFIVAATVDNGATWLPMWTFAEPMRPEAAWVIFFDGAARIDGYPVLGSASLTKSWDGIHGRWHLRLPEAAFSAPNVKVGVFLHEPADAWYMAFDNIVIDDNGPPQGAETVLTENFENGIPATWSNTTGKTQKWGTEPLADELGYLRGYNIDLIREMQTAFNDGYNVPEDPSTLTWSNEDFDTYTDLYDLNPNGALDGRWMNMLAGGNYAIWSDGDDTTESGNLDTPLLNLSGTSAVFLEFDSEMLRGDGSSFYDVYVSVNNRQTFERIWTYTGALMDNEEGAYFMRHYIPVPAAADKSQVVFRFAAKGGDPSEYEGFWAIDNVGVTIDRGGEIPEPPVKPQVTAPASIAALAGFQLDGSAFQDPDPGDTLARAFWVVAYDAAMTQVVIQATKATDATMLAVGENVLLPGHTYYATVQYEDQTGLKSPVSDPAMFNTGDFANVIFAESFNGAPDFGLPAGWTEENYTDTATPGLDPANASSDTYKPWTVVPPATLQGFGGPRLSVPSVLQGKSVYAESDNRSGKQVQYLKSPVINLNGATDVHLFFGSNYVQNQDSMGALEYTIDGGATWLPLLYMIATADITGWPDAIDAQATMTAVWSDVADVDGGGGTYGEVTLARPFSAMAPFISGRVDDNATESKRLELLRVQGADGKANVQFRLVQSGTGSWFWGVDDFKVVSIPTGPAEGAEITAISIGAGGMLQIDWTGGTPPYQVQSAPSLAPASWQNVGGTVSFTSLSVGLPNAPAQFYQVLSGVQ